jgi:hypothetical protein
MKYLLIGLLVLSIIGAAISIFDSYRIEMMYKELEDHMLKNNDNDNDRDKED